MLALVLALLSLLVIYDTFKYLIALITRRKLLIISGISGSGKTYLGAHYAAINKWYHIDQDSYYLANKPTVILSNGKRTSNWDCDEAINWSVLQEAIQTALTTQSVVLTGFAPFHDYLGIAELKKRDVLVTHIHLVTSDNKDEVINNAISFRRQSKHWTPEKEQLDELVVKEVVYPFYIAGREKYKIDLLINVNPPERITHEEFVRLVEPLI